MDTATLSGGMTVAADTNPGATVTILPWCYHMTNTRRSLPVATQHQSKAYLQALNNLLTDFKGVSSEEILPGHPKELSYAFILQDFYRCYTMIQYFLNFDYWLCLVCAGMVKSFAELYLIGYY